MKYPDWELCDHDVEFFERELDSFVPDKVYDVHAHLWRKSDWGGRTPVFAEAGPAEVTLATYREHMAWILPRREVHGLHFAFPAAFPNDPGPPNAWVSRQIAGDPLARGQLYVRPTDDPDWVRQEVRRLGLRGLKPFAGFADRPDIGNAEIPEYFPEPLAALAHEEGWSVTLHLQRPRSLADPSNLHWLRVYCGKYPDMALILDHSARGFNPFHCLEGLEQLDPQRLPGLHVDTSVNCVPLATIACLRRLGPERVLYGSDYYCSHMRGANFPVGDSFVWLDQDTYDWDNVLYGAPPVLVGLANLQAVKAAFQVLGLGDSAVEAYFRGNAVRILGLA